ECSNTVTTAEENSLNLPVKESIYDQTPYSTQTDEYYIHPLSGKRTILTGGNELAIINIYRWNTHGGLLLDDEEHDFSAMTTIDEYYLSVPDCVAGDFDGDGRDELLLSSTYSTTYAKITDYSESGFTDEYVFSDYGEITNVATGDIDGDGVSEIILNDYYTVYVLDETNHDYILLQQFSPSGIAIFSLVTADIDGDDRDEILFSGIGLTSIKIHDDVQANFTLLWSKSSEQMLALISDYFITASGCDYYQLVTGDFDGDGVSEFILTFKLNSNSPGFIIFDDYTTNFDVLEYGIGSGNVEEYDNPKYQLKVTSGNIDDDRYDEIIFWREIVGYKGLSYCLVEIYDDLNNIQKIAEEDFGYNLDEYSLLLTEEKSLDVKAGDVDFDGKDEIVFSWLYHSFTRTSTSYSAALNPSTMKYECKVLSYSQAGSILTELKNFEQIIDYGSDWEDFYPKIVLGDFDGDCITLEYTEYNYFTYSNPYIIILLAAPPTVGNIVQNYDQSATKYGKSVSGSSTVGNGHTTTTSAIIGVTGDYKILSAEARLSMTYEFMKTETETKTITTYTEFVGDYQDNYIVFETVEYQNYVYKIISHPNALIIGTNTSIIIPREQNIQKWTLTSFNQEFEGTITINDFTHTIGQPWTYPTTIERDKIDGQTDAFWKSDKMAVGKENGYNVVGIDLSKENTTEKQLSMEIGFEITYSAILLRGYYTGVTDNWIYSITIGENTAYEGSVGDIDSNYYDKYHYSFGLYVYNYNNSDYGISYQVVNYWVEDYLGPHELPTESISPSGTESSPISGFGAIVTSFSLGILILTLKKRKLQ
ncbi:MAG: FG-GAP repeat domain-containing protein, partial [Candidatus Hodarchaeales archaeon]